MTCQRLRLLVATLLFSILVACATVPENKLMKWPGDTRADPLLQRDTLKSVLLMDISAEKGCDQRTLVNTEIVQRPTAEKKTAVERWILDRCGKLIPYLVTFRFGSTGTFFDVRQED